jgi:hypothetical protein
MVQIVQMVRALQLSGPEGKSSEWWWVPGGERTGNGDVQGAGSPG